MEALEILVCTIVVVSYSCALYLWGLNPLLRVMEGKEGEDAG